jgi:hypothetical protein
MSPISAIETQEERKTKSNLSRKRRETKAVMGRPDGLVKAGGSKVYITLGNGKIETVFNSRVSVRSYKKIVVGFDEETPLLYQVLREDRVYNDIPKPTIPPHKDSHLWYGEDPAEIHPQSFMALSPRAKAGFVISVFFGFYQIDSLHHIFPTTDIDLSGEVVAAGAEWVNVEVDDSLNITFQHSAAVANKSLLLPEDIPATDPTKYLLCSVRMYYGQVRINQAPTNNDIFDPRFSFGRSGGGAGTPAGADTEIQFNDAGAFGADPTFTRNSDGSITIGDFETSDIPTSPYSIQQASTGSSVANFLATYGATFASYITFVFGRGTKSSPTAAQADDVIGRIRGRAYDDAGNVGTTSVEMRLIANETHDGSGHGTRIEFHTTPDNSTTLTEGPTIEADGHIDANSHKITSVTDPTSAQDAATKAYVDTKQPLDGWIPDTNTWSHDSIDSPIGIISVDADVTGVIGIGDKIKYDQDVPLTYYWSFDTNSAGDVGSPGMSNVGTPTYAAGKFGNALTLNGTNQALSVTDAANLKPTGDWTIGLCFKSGATGRIHSLFQTYSDNTNANGIRIEVTAANVVSVWTGNNQAADASQQIGSKVVADGTWHRIVVRSHNNLIDIYVDDDLDPTHGQSLHVTKAPTYAATNYVSIGVRNVAGASVAGTWCNGQIDDLFFINGYALDEGTIRAKYREDTAQGTGDITVTKMAIVHHVAPFSAGETLITAFYGTDFMQGTGTMSNPHYSHAKTPFGYNPDKGKWSVYYYDIPTTFAKATPTANQYYSDSGLTPTAPTVEMPIGAWDIEAGAQPNHTYTTVAVQNMAVRFGLAEASGVIPIDYKLLGLYLLPSAAGALSVRVMVKLLSEKTVAVKTTFYPCIAAGNVISSTISIIGFLTVKFTSKYA